MGCFNETCLITGAHITAGDDVAVVLLQPDKNKSRFGCYSSFHASPAPLLIYGKYNDYGSVEDISEGLTLNILVDSIKDKLVEMDLGENEFHDVEVKKKDFDVEKLLEAAWEGRLRIANIFKEAAPSLQYAFIHGHVFHKIMNEYNIRNMTNIDNEYKYYTYSFKAILNDVPEFVDALMAYLKKDDPLKMFMLDRRRLNLVPHMNLAQTWFSFETIPGNYNSVSVFTPMDFLTEHGQNLSREDLVEFVTEALKVAWLNSFMNHANKPWIKPSSAGQECNWRPHELLNAAVAEIIQDYNADYEEEFDEEEDNKEEDINFDVDTTHLRGIKYL